MNDCSGGGVQKQCDRTRCRVVDGGLEVTLNSLRVASPLKDSVVVQASNPGTGEGCSRRECSKRWHGTFFLEE